MKATAPKVTITIEEEGEHTAVIVFKRAMRITYHDEGVMIDGKYEHVEPTYDKVMNTPVVDGKVADARVWTDMVHARLRRKKLDYEVGDFDYDPRRMALQKRKYDEGMLLKEIADWLPIPEKNVMGFCPRGILSAQLALATKYLRALLEVHDAPAPVVGESSDLVSGIWENRIVLEKPFQKVRYAMYGDRDWSEVEIIELIRAAVTAGTGHKE